LELLLSSKKHQSSATNDTCCPEQLREALDWRDIDMYQVEAHTNLRTAYHLEAAVQAWQKVGMQLHYLRNSKPVPSKGNVQIAVSRSRAAQAWQLPQHIHMH